MNGVCWLERTSRIALASCVALLAACQTDVARDEVAAEIAVLQLRVARIQDAHDIKRLQRAYGYYIDKGFWDEAADLFSSEATADYGSEGVYRGQQNIREYLRRMGGGRTGPAEGVLNNHMQLQPVVHVAPNGLSAKGRWRSLIMIGRYGESASWGEGVYENEYIREGGVWKISKLRWYPRFVVPYEQGWARTSLPKYSAPFHYAHPSRPGARKREPAASPSLAEWHRIVDRVEAYDAIENLQAMYGYYFDGAAWDDVAALFTQEASFEVAQRGVYRGRERIRAALELEGPAGARAGVLNTYMQLQPVIHVAPDGRTARARWRAVVQTGVAGQGAQWGEGTYENEYVREDGVWKISKLHYYVTVMADYDKGWAAGPLPIARASEQLPPDAPPTEAYESFPGVYLPPYHYRNPATAAEPLRLPPAENGPLRALAREVQRLADEHAIENLQRSYGYYVDKSQWDEVSELFAANGTLEIGGRGVFAGKERVREYMYFLGRQGPQPGQLFNHSQFQPIIHVSDDGRSARGRWRALVMGAVAPRFAVWGEVTYENEYVKEADVWKISRLYAFFNMYTPYADGWAKTGMPNTRPEQRLPPDRPPTVVYEMYPAAGMVPFHYPNPVTGK